MAKRKPIRRLKDERLPAVIKAAYDIGRFEGRCEVIDDVRHEMAMAKLGVFAMAQEVKHLDALNRGLVSIFIDQTTAEMCLAALRKSKTKSNKGYIKMLTNKLKAARALSLER